MSDQKLHKMALFCILAYHRSVVKKGCKEGIAKFAKMPIRKYIFSKQRPFKSRGVVIWQIFLGYVQFWGPEMMNIERLFLS